MSKEWNPENIFEILASEMARKILAAASVKPMSARELGEICETSLPTVYRRVNALYDYDLLSEQPRVDSDGTRYNLYTTDLDEVTIQVDDGGFNININVRKDSVDQLDELLEDLTAGQKPPNDQSDDADSTSGSFSPSGG
jgi:DNA-binding transcriptional ArsR family regulator